MIGSPSNKALLREAGLLAAEGEQAGANDLIIAVRAVDERRGREARCTRPGSCRETDSPLGNAAARRAASPRGAATRCRGANLALISVPGEFAAAEARKALDAGLHVLMFSSRRLARGRARAQAAGAREAACC